MAILDSSSVASGAAVLAPAMRFRAEDASGNPLVGGKLYTFQAGTALALATYTDATLNTPNTNPVLLDSRGEADVWLAAGPYKFVLQDANGVQIEVTDNIPGSGNELLTNPAGDQTIATGKLTVTGGFEGPIGTASQNPGAFSDVTVTASTSKVRLNNFTGVGQGISANLQADGVTRDIPARWGGAYIVDTINGGFKARMVSPGGTVRDYALRMTAGCTFVSTVNTGSTTLNSVWSRTLLGGTLGANGGFRVRIYFNATVQGAPQTLVGLYMNGTQVARMLTPASTAGIYKYTLTIGNRNAQNSQITYAEPVYLGASAAVLQGQAVASAIDTSADTVIEVRVQNGSNTDSITVDAIETELFTTFAI